MNLLSTIECTCVNCKRVAHIPRWESKWSCYECGRINRLAPEPPKDEDPFAEFLRFNGASR